MDHDSSTGLMAALRTALVGATPGSRLPSSRELVRRHRVSPVTVTATLRELATEGLVDIRPGNGTFVATQPLANPAKRRDTSWQTVALGARTVDATGVAQMLAAPPEGSISLASGYLHESLQATRALAAAAGRATRRPGVWGAAPPAGHPELRSWFAASIGGGVNASEVLITSGGQAALSSTLRALLPAGAPLVVESPTYVGALAIARAAGLVPVPVPVDRAGLRADLLAEALASSGARVVLAMPGLHNPTGAVMGAARRTEVLNVVRAAGAFLVEDDWARWLGHSHRPGAAPDLLPPMVATDDDGTVIHLSSLTKISAPSLRIGAVIARGPAAERIRGLRMVDDLFISRPLQELALELVSSPAWTRHLRFVGTELQARQQVLLEALATHAPTLSVTPPPAAGLHVWARLPEGHDDLEVTEQAARAGIMVSAGRRYFAAEPPGAYLRLTGTAAASAESLIEATQRLGVVLAGR